MDVGNVIRVITGDERDGMLLTITRKEHWGIEAVMVIPYKGLSYFRFRYDEFTVVGQPEEYHFLDFDFPESKF